MRKIEHDAGALTPFGITNSGCELSREQVSRIQEIIAPSFSYLARLKVNLEERKGFYPQFGRVVSKAHEGLEELSMFLRYEDIRRENSRKGGA
ncbi:hypothetical protein TA3x_005820 (plasmid) [Tundrisphaera sp. TA3]|uniref:hypothetical protein n=1 Tax=Tundrisphaera sp. TA3 TaxID=3435775 RepID=UPI003EBA7FE6